MILIKLTRKRKGTSCIFSPSRKHNSNLYSLWPVNGVDMFVCFGNVLVLRNASTHPCQKNCKGHVIQNGTWEIWSKDKNNHFWVTFRVLLANRWLTPLWSALFAAESGALCLRSPSNGFRLFWAVLFPTTEPGFTLL